MYNNIKLKTLGVHKRKVLLIFFVIVINMFTMVACMNNEIQLTTQEFELVSCYIEYRNRTNFYGGVMGTDEYLHYGYANDNGQVTFDEIRSGYYIDFQITEETPKVIIKTSPTETTYTFQLTREMYNNLNSSQK